MKKYSDEEKEILSSYKNKTLLKATNSKEGIKKAKLTANQTLIKSKQVHVRLTEKEMIKLKIKASESGLSFQSLLSALVHQFIEDRIHIKI